MSHDHNHDHEERELITLVDEQGNETLFEILLTIDGKEEFGKNYVLLVPVNAEEDEDGQVEIQAYSFIENEDGTEGELQPIPEDSEDEWNMIEEVFNSFMEEWYSLGDCISPTPRNWEELERPVDVFSPALEIRNAGSPGDVFTPTPRN